MKRILAAVAAVLGLLASSGQATASGPADSALQAAGQAAASGQAAGAQSGAVQSQPANRNVSVRVLSPGNNGDVSQSNTVGSEATAANANITGQSADQSQAGLCDCAGGTQAVGQEAHSSQSAAALSQASQEGAKNTNIPVRVLSPGDDGSVEQANSVESGALAANANGTAQSAEQAGSGSGTQATGQSAASEQQAAAASKAEQKGAENANISVRVLSPGNDGDVSQSNSVDSSAAAGNVNLTGQHADQAQGGSGGIQAVGQDAGSKQAAGAVSTAKQEGAKNTNVPVRVLSPGNDGDVSQSNSVASSATAGNLNALEQDAHQARAGRDACGCSSGGTQAIGQDAWNGQTAVAGSLAAQTPGRDECGCASGGNANVPVRVDSDGGGGSVEQANDTVSTAKSGNLNLTKQAADQAQSGSGGTQAIGQDAHNEQGAAAFSAALQAGAKNENTPVRVHSKGDGGDVSQSNTVASAATALNADLTRQDAHQAQGRSGCGCSGSTGVQAVGQEASSSQLAAALSLALQAGASNESTPVRVSSDGGGGSVDQSNTVASLATALNLNALEQDADQAQGGGGGIAVQAIAQSAKSEQLALALSAALQLGAANRSSPVLVGSEGGGGDVTQSNDARSAAAALNGNLLGQAVGQQQAGGCACREGPGVQALGQSAKSRQGSLAGSLGSQCGAEKDVPFLPGGTSLPRRGYPTPDRWRYC